MNATPRPSGSPFCLTIPADLSRLAEARAWIGEIAGTASLDDSRSFDLQVAVSEATANAIEHAASGVELVAHLLPDRLIVEITNDGVFQPGLYKDDEHRRRGLGLPLMVSLADQVHVSSLAQSRTRVSLTFFLESHSHWDSPQPGLIEATEIKATDREAEDRYRKLVDLSPDAILVNLSGTYVFANPAAATLLGAGSPAELVGTSVLRHVHPDDRELVAERTGQILSGAIAPPREIRLLRLDGTPVLAEVTGSRVEFDGRLAAQAVMHDITERKRVEEALRESEERFRTMADAIPQLAWIANADGYIYWYNRRWYEYTGTTLAEMEGWGWQSVHDPVALPGVRERWQQSIATGEPFDMEFPLRGADGEFRPFLTRVMPQKDADGSVLQWFGTNTDLSERARAEEAIKENEDRVSFALEVSHTGAWDLDLSGHTAHRSIEHDRIFGYESLLPEWTYEMFLDHVVPEDREVVDQKFQAAISARGDWNFECRIRRADGEVRWIWAAGRHRPGIDGGLRMAGIVQDVTGRRAAEERLLGLNRTLKAHSDSDQALIRATDEASYLQEVCRIIVEDCGHAMIWIGYKEDDEAKSIRPVASAGFEEGYLDAIKVTWADSERGRGPTGTAVRTGRPSICRDMLTDPAFAPWRDEALRRGYASSLALPLVHSGTALGAITIYASEPDPFSDDEVKLLADLTDDLALGITTLRLRAAHAETERERDILLAEEQQLTEELLATNEELQYQADELAAREEELQVQNEELRASRYNRTLIEASLDPLVTIGLDGTITDVNEATINITGRTREELLGTDFSDYFTDPESARMGYREAFAKGSVTDYPLTVRAYDGKLTDVLYNASVYKDQHGNVLGVFAAARDMTAVKELEEQRDIASTLQKALLDLPQELPGLRLAHLYRSATQKAVVGGDFYDVFKLKDGRIAILIGDVSGHGVEAARLATLVRDVIHVFAHQSTEPALVLKNTNNLLIEKETPGFVTVFLGILDPVTGLLVYTSAGHPNALLRSPSGEVELLQAASAPVGVFPDRSWEQNEAQLEKDDILFLYTDGAIEARRNGDFFGQEGLVKALGGWNDPSLELLPQTLLDQVLSFSGGELTDDVAMLALRLGDDGKILAVKG